MGSIVSLHDTMAPPPPDSAFDPNASESSSSSSEGQEGSPGEASTPKLILLNDFVDAGPKQYELYSLVSQESYYEVRSCPVKQALMSYYKKWCNDALWTKQFPEGYVYGANEIDVKGAVPPPPEAGSADSVVESMFDSPSEYLLYGIMLCEDLRTSELLHKYKDVVNVMNTANVLLTIANNDGTTDNSPQTAAAAAANTATAAANTPSGSTTQKASNQVTPGSNRNSDKTKKGSSEPIENGNDDVRIPFDKAISPFAKYSYAMLSLLDELLKPSAKLNDDDLKRIKVVVQIICSSCKSFAEGLSGDDLTSKTVIEGNVMPFLLRSWDPTLVTMNRVTMQPFAEQLSMVVAFRHEALMSETGSGKGSGKNSANDSVRRRLLPPRLCSKQELIRLDLDDDDDDSGAEDDDYDFSTYHNAETYPELEARLCEHCPADLESLLDLFSPSNKSPLDPSFVGYDTARSRVKRFMELAVDGAKWLGKESIPLEGTVYAGVSLVPDMMKLPSDYDIDKHVMANPLIYDAVKTIYKHVKEKNDVIAETISPLSNANMIDFNRQRYHGPSGLQSL